MEKDEKMVAQTKAKKEKAASNGKSVKLKSTGNSLTGKPLDNVDINPQLDDRQVNEQSRGGVVLTFGRMNPPTVGHEKLVQKVMTVANQKKATPMVFLSHSQDKKKNPLEYEDKIRFARAAFGRVVQQSPAKTLIDILKTLQSKYSDLTLVVGSDRVQEFETLLNKYNGKDYTFNTINVVSAGERDPDAEGVSGMSASKMGDAVSKGDQRKFVSGLPRALQTHGKQVFDLVRAGMQLHEELEAEGLLSEVIDIQQRRKRALIMKRFAPRIKRAREIAKKRLAPDKRIRKRAYMKARDIVRKRVAGRRGAEYKTLSPSEKIQVDIAVEKRKKIIGKIAQRIMPKVKAAEFQRLKSFMKGSALAHNHSGPKVQHEQLNHVFEQYASSIEITDVDTMLEQMAELVLNKMITEKQESALMKRADRAGIEYDLLEQVYKRGLFDSMGDEQAAFNRVNAFMCGGRTAMNEDKDLYDLIQRSDINDVFEAREPNKPYVKPHSGGAWKASNKWGKVKYFGKDFKKSAEKHAGISEAEVWDKPSPAKKPDKLTAAQKAKAKARAARAGRPYPNMVDNIWATNEELDLAFEQLAKGTQVRQSIDVITRSKQDRQTIHKVGRPSNNPDDAKMNKQRQIMNVIGEDSPADREVGTDKLVKKYKKDTPGQSLDESFNMAINAGVGITLTAADLGMKAQGGFTLHPSVIEDEDITNEDV